MRLSGLRSGRIGRIPRTPFFPGVRARRLTTSLTPPGTRGIEIEPRKSTNNIFTLTIEVKDQSGIPLTFHVSTRALITAVGDTPSLTTFRELVNDPGAIKTQAFGSDRSSGLVAPTWGGAEFNNTEGQFDAWAEYVTDGGKVTCRYGPFEGLYPEEYRTAYVAYIDGRPQFDKRKMRLSYRGRERLFDRKVVTEAFVPTVSSTYGSVDLGGTGVAGARLKFLVIGTPGYIEPVLINAVDNLWFLQANYWNDRFPAFFDGGVALSYGGLVGGGVPPAAYALAALSTGDVYAQLGSEIRFEARIFTSGAYVSATESLRRWNIVDLARRAGITDADPGTLPEHSIPFDAGNRVVETQTYKDVLNDIASFEVASIGFTRLDKFYARRIEPSWVNASVYTFTDGVNASKLEVATINGLEKRVWKVQVQSGETHKSALAGVVDADVRDALSRDPWMSSFTATAQSVYTLDPSAEIIELQIAGNEFISQTVMAAWALRYLKVHGSHSFSATIEAPLNVDTMALDLLDTVTIVSDRFGCESGRSAVIWSIDMQLKRRVIQFGLWSHRASDAPNSGTIVIKASDDTVGAGGNGSGSGKTGTGSATVQNESFVIACSDESTALTAGTTKRSFFVPYDFHLVEVQAELTTVQSAGSIFTVDINEGGASILSTKLTIDNTESTSITAVTPYVISDAFLAKGAKVTIDIDQIGNGTAKGLSVTLIGYQV